MPTLLRLSSPLCLALGFLILGGSAPTFGQNQEAPRAVGMLSLEEAAPGVPKTAHAAFHGNDGEGKDGPLAAVGPELALLYYQQQTAGVVGVQALFEGSQQRRKTRTSDRRPRTETGRVLSPVSPDGRFVTVDAVATGNPSRLLENLRELGLEGGALAGSVVSGRLPIASVKQAAALSSLRGMVPAYARTTAGSVGSEADTAHAADVARLNTGTSGSGQKVCALSDSYDTASAATSAGDDVQSGDLPGQNNPEGRTTPVDVLDDGADGDDEGRAMLQLIHDIAPEAELGFHTAFGGIGVFASGIRDLADAGCTVIVDDVRYSSEPFYQDGPVTNAIDDVVTNDGAAYFSSAGNDGQNSYGAPFRSSGKPGVIDSSSVAHDFDPSASITDTRQEITIQSGGTFQVFSLQWTDPSALVEGSSGPDTDLDIALVDSTGTPVAQSASANVSTGVPSEFLEYTNDGSTAETLYLVIEKAAGPDPDRVKYVYSGSGPFTDSDVTIEEHDTLGPTVYGHPMAEGAMAVAAAPFFNTAAYNPSADPATLEAFSSKGGLQIRFDQNGDPLPTPQDREKPDVTGTDGVDNTFFGSDIRDSFFDGVDADPHPNFFGTSAAAPNIAAIGALIRQARPGLAPPEVYSRLEGTAADVTSRQRRDGEFVVIPDGQGVDPWSGHGFVQANQAVPETENQPPVASADTFKIKQDSSLSLEAPGVLKNDSDPDGEPLDASVVTRPSEGELTLQSDGGLEYVPEPAFAGTDRFRYAASDPRGLSDTSAVEIQVEAREAPEIATRIAPSDTTVDSGEDLTLTQTIENGATNTADLEVQVTEVPNFLALESSVISVGDGSVDTTGVTLGPGAEAVLTYSLEESVDTTKTFEGTISHRTNDPRNSTVDLSVTVTVKSADLFEIAGSVTYPTTSDGKLTEGRSLEGVAVEARSGDTTAVDTTSAGGSFAIEGLPAGNYEVRPLPSGPTGNVSTADALRVVRGFTGLEAFTGDFQRQVADVNASGTANVTDALQIARFDLGLIDGFSAGDFVVKSDSVSVGDADVPEDNISGIDVFFAEVGDARLNGGETRSTAASTEESLGATTLSPGQGTSRHGTSGRGAPASKTSAPKTSASKTQSSGASGSEAIVGSGKTFEVPVRMGQGAKVGAYQMTIDYASETASFEGVRADHDGVLANVSEEGTVQISWFDQTGRSPLELEDGSELAALRFTAAEEVEDVEFAPEISGGEISGPAADPLSVGVELQAVRVGGPMPEEFALKGSYPNPTAEQITVEMDLPTEAQVTVEVYNAIGQRVKTVEQPMGAGSGQTVRVDGSGLASGQYFYRVEATLEEDKTVRETGQITVVR